MKCEDPIYPSIGKVVRALQRLAATRSTWQPHIGSDLRFGTIGRSRRPRSPESRLTPPAAESLFFAGDIGQRIFQHPFSWLSLGIDIRGLSHTLKVNYRTSHQIRRQADLLLDSELQDPDGNVESRRHTISVFNGPMPTVQICKSEKAESETVRKWLQRQQEIGIKEHEIGIIIRSEDDRLRAEKIIADQEIQPAIVLMHDAKGLEFRSVAIVACDEEAIPLKSRIESAADMHELGTLLETERHLLYVAATRAREHLLITARSPGSEFLADIL